MSFLSPHLLWALLLVPALLAGYLLLQRRRMRYAMRFTNVDLLANIVDASPRWRRHVPPAVFLLALAALLFAMARPQLVTEVPREEASVVLATDVSGSMQATDVSPTRLDAAERAANRFLDRVPEELRVGLVTFSSEAQVVVQPTERSHERRSGLAAPPRGRRRDCHRRRRRSRHRSGCPHSGRAARSATRPTEDGPALVVLLLSDGAPSPDTLDPIEAAQKAKAAGIPVYTIALGTDEGTVEVVDELGFTRDHRGAARPRDAGGDRPHHRRRRLLGTDRAGPRRRLRPSRLEHRLRGGAAGDHVRLRGRWARPPPRRRNAVRSLVQPSPLGVAQCAPTSSLPSAVVSLALVAAGCGGQPESSSLSSTSVTAAAGSTTPSQPGGGSGTGSSSGTAAPAARGPLADMVERVLPSLVNVRVQLGGGGGFLEDLIGGGEGEGSGVIIDENGTILTNNHVVQDAESVIDRVRRRTARRASRPGSRHRSRARPRGRLRGRDRSPCGRDRQSSRACAWATTPSRSATRSGSAARR